MDPELLHRFRLGDEEAVKTVYERFHGPVFAVTLSILGDHALAADATQQTFIKAWRAAADFQPERSLAPWIYTIARRTAIDMLRKQNRALVSDNVDQVTDPPGIDTVWEIFEVRTALDRLPDDEREVLRLSHFVGLTHGEIAEHLGIPVGTVKSRTHRAHQRLIGLLDHLRDPGENREDPPGVVGDEDV